MRYFTPVQVRMDLLCQWPIPIGVPFIYPQQVWVWFKADELALFFFEYYIRTNSGGETYDAMVVRRAQRDDRVLI